jgi:hypothetical protein
MQNHPPALKRIESISAKFSSETNNKKDNRNTRFGG